MRLSINHSSLKTLVKPAIAALAAVGMTGIGYLGCQYFGRAAMFTTAGCLGGLGGTAALVETIKNNAQPSTKKGA